MGYVESDSHMELWESENYVSPEELDWYRWYDQLESEFGNPDGDFDRDGYSLDNFYDMWKAGYTVQQAIANKSVLMPQKRSGWWKVEEK